jgi:hypothetical protein
VLEPQLTVLPEVGANGVMLMAGYFPSVPLQVNFELQFTGVDGRWRLLGIAVNVGAPAPSPPAASSSPAAPAASSSGPAAPAQTAEGEAKPVEAKRARPPTPRPAPPARP